MNVTLQSAPSVEPLTLAETKVALGIDTNTTFNQTLIGDYITAARQSVEQITHRRLITQTLDVGFDLDEWSRWSIGGVWYLPFPPLQSITTFTTYDEDDNGTALVAGTNYTLSGLDPAKIRQTGAGWNPTRTNEAVVLRIIVGYGDAATDVPDALREYMMMLVREMFENREERTVGPQLALNPYVFGGVL